MDLTRKEKMEIVILIKMESKRLNEYIELLNETISTVYTESEKENRILTSKEDLKLYESILNKLNGGL